MGPEAVVDTVQAFADFLLKYFVALAAVGALAMAILELFKKVLKTQMHFNARRVTDWLRREGPDTSEAPPHAAFEQLIQLTTGVARERSSGAARQLLRHVPRAGLARHPEHALFVLSLETMMGHIQEAVEVAINNPNRYAALYDFATSGAELEDRNRWRNIADTPPMADVEGSIDRHRAKERADLYARLHQCAKRKLDSFQLYSTDRWINMNQLWANVVGAVVLFGALVWIRSLAPASEQLSYGSLVVISLLGGMLAPVAKDIVVALQKVRGG